MSATPSDLLLFQVGPRVYAAGVHEVRRIGAVHEGHREDLVLGSILGEPLRCQRGIVVDCADEGERTLIVDQVLGVRTVAVADLRPLPPFAAMCLGSAAVRGLALLDETPTLLIDLPTLIRERNQAGTGSRPEERLDDA